MDCEAVLDYIRAIHKGKEAPKVGLLTYNNAYGRSIHKPSREYAAKQNINIVAIEEFPPKTVDLTTELLRLQKSGAEYIFMQMLPAAIITAFQERGPDRLRSAVLRDLDIDRSRFLQDGSGADPESSPHSVSRRSSLGQEPGDEGDAGIVETL